jgi:N-acetylglutamate synthase-like GNAT family acetyltransferase
MDIVEIDFETILPVWRDRLWPGRQSEIEPYSAMTLCREFNLDFSGKQRKFLAGMIDGEIVAVNSVHLAESTMARSRGLWVDPLHRGNGYGTKILIETCVKAKELGAEIIWTFPRKSSFHTYDKVG